MILECNYEAVRNRLLSVDPRHLRSIAAGRVHADRCSRSCGRGGKLGQKREVRASEPPCGSHQSFAEVGLPIRQAVQELASHHRGPAEPNRTAFEAEPELAAFPV